MYTKTEYSILKVLAYYDLFSYPVSPEEILYFLDQQMTEIDLLIALNQLEKKQCIFRFDEFYSLQNNPLLVVQRKKSNAQAQSLLKTAYKVAHLLFRVPYVRGISISGSLSKNCADESADIDFFIITRKNRLWIARTLMILIRKLAALAKRQHWFCLNYYIDDNDLKIPEQNIFTATEIITLLPVCGNGTMEKFFKANSWAVSYYPNYIIKIKESKSAYPKSLIKYIIETILNNRFGDWLDKCLMKLTTGWWKKKKLEEKLNKRNFRMEIKTSRHFIKPNPSLFQEKIVTSYYKKLHDLEEKWNSNFQINQLSKK